MKVNARQEGDVKILDLEGRIVLGDGDAELKNAVNAALGDGSQKIVINLRGVPYMDSAGLGEMMACKKRGLDKKAEVALVIPPGSKIPLAVQTCLRLAFDVFDDERAAVASFRG